MFQDQQGKEVATHNAAEVNEHHGSEPAHLLDVFGEKIETDHVEDQVPEISMDQSTTKEPVPLPSFDSGRVEDQLLRHPRVAECRKGDQGGQDDDDECKG